MSRAEKTPIIVPQTVKVAVGSDGRTVTAEGGTKAKMKAVYTVHDSVRVKLDQPDKLWFSSEDHGCEEKQRKAILGTMRAIVKNMLCGISKEYEIRLLLFGVGYKAQIRGKEIVLNVRYSHPVVFNVPVGVSIEVNSPTDIVVKGIDKQLVGQFAAILRASSPPDPYKGKGIRYADEVVKLKEVKKSK